MPDDTQKLAICACDCHRILRTETGAIFLGRPNDDHCDECMEEQ